RAPKDEPAESVAVEERAGAEQLIREIGALSEANHANRDPETERRILSLRHEAAARAANEAAGGREPQYAAPAYDRLPNGSAVPEIASGELTAELLRAAILRSGCLLVRGLFDARDAEDLVEEIDRAFEARDTGGAGGQPAPAYYEEFVPEPPYMLMEREWVADAGGIWAADSPRAMFAMLEAFERAGLTRVATDYLGERPAISVQKCTLRKVEPDIFGEVPVSAWHQDGAFLGDVRALNVWLSLSRCGDVAPGLDLVPRRLEEIVPTGTEGAVFDWSVSQTVAEQAAGDAAIARPIFDPGDVLLFDELFLHSTAAGPEMTNRRYAIESWFFGPSAFPEGYVPLAA
ncbi:MAG: hypothetical protein ACRDLO_01685, partial [Solirubrobacterales bacterium]